ncbi:MAG: TetR/AcrR family transcriptional regulator [Desulfosudaceae bacterium]
MPKAPMTKEEINQVRNQILETALDIIITEGFSNLSFRKIAARLNITATTIYNYFEGKDELNLMIRVRGFETLYALLKKAGDRQDSAPAALEAMLRAYVRFGLTYPDYYDLMFNLNTPKYLDYVGSDMEPTAHFEKQTALKCLNLFAQPIEDYLDADKADKAGFIQDNMVQFWSDLHGLVALYNSRLFHEVLADVEDFVEKRLQRLILEIQRLRQQIDQGLPLTAITPALN